MSDITHARKAEELIREHDSLPWSDQAMIHAELATARAAREVDTTIRQSVRALQEALVPRANGEQWLTWELEGRHGAIQVRHIRAFSTQTDAITNVELDDGRVLPVPLSYGTVAMTVGA